MVVCLTSARFNMKADVLRQGYEDGPNFNPVDETGEWVQQQNPRSGEIVRIWQPNPELPSAPVGTQSLESFSCVARGIIDGGIRVSGTTERFGATYDNIDYVKITFPASVKISKRDRITNIRDSRGTIIWKEEEQPEAPPTVFNVTGVTPILDPFGRHIESFALLERSSVQ